MHRTFGYLSKRITRIQPGEGRKVLLTFLFFFLVIAAYYVIKPASRSLILEKLGFRLVPYADLVCVIIMGPIVTLFARLADRCEKPKLVSAVFWVVSGVMVLFWFLLSLERPWIVGAFYVWVAVFSVLVVTLFWLVANDLYRAREAKRLFGFVGSGGILGGIVGSSIAAAGAHFIGTYNLLLVCAALLICCWAIARRLWPFAFSPARSEDAPLKKPRGDSFLSNISGFVRIIKESRYLLLLVCIVGLGKIISTFVYYRFNPFIEEAFAGVDAKTAFLGLFYQALNVTAFAIQFFFTSWLLRRKGLLWALIILPAGLLMGNFLLLFIPIFWIAGATELYDCSLVYSLHNSAKEALYLPIDSSIRYKVKPFIDLVVFRFGKGIAAIAGIILLDYLGMPARYLSAIVIPLALVWFFVALSIRKEYAITTRTILRAKATARRQQMQPTETMKIWAASDMTGSLLNDTSTQRKLSLIPRIFDGHEGSDHYAELLEKLRSYEGPAGAVRLDACAGVNRFKREICNQSNSLGVRRQAIRMLSRYRNQETLDYLCGLLVVEEDVLLNQEVSRALASLRLSDRGLQFPETQIRRQIEREIQKYQRIVQVTGVYRQHARGSIKEDDPILAMLRTLLEDSSGQIFRLLILICNPEDIHLIYERIREPDTYVRTDAIEFLDNLLDTKMRAMIFPLLDEDRFLSLVDMDADKRYEPTVAYRVLQQAIWDHSCWLSVTTLCAATRLRLTELRGEVTKAIGHPNSIISAAARLVL